MAHRKLTHLRLHFHECVKKLGLADSITLKFSHGISITLLVIYACFVHFQIRSIPVHSETHAVDEEARGDGDYDGESESNLPEDHMQSVPLRPVMKGRLRRSTPEKSIRDSTSQQIGRIASLILLLISATLASLCAEFVVDSIEHVITDAPLTEAFLGLIILPLLGNASELGTAVAVAAKSKLDLAINVAVGSAIQIILFVAPAMVLIAWLSGKELSLYFDLFQIVTLLATIIIVSIMMLSGRSNYLLGILLLASYVVIG